MENQNLITTIKNNKNVRSVCPFPGKTREIVVIDTLDLQLITVVLNEVHRSNNESELQ